MTQERYLRRDDTDFCLAHVVEEAGEVLSAAGKAQRWGFYSVNPDLLEADRETNIDWLLREMDDLVDAIQRFKASLS